MVLFMGVVVADLRVSPTFGLDFTGYGVVDVMDEHSHSVQTGKVET